MDDKAKPLGITPEQLARNKREICAKVAQSLEADVLLYNGPILRPFDVGFHAKCRTRPSRAKNVLLVLVTEGGDPDAAYRMSRCLQEHYEQFFCMVSGWCKSAGTLITVGAHELIFTAGGELGPLDVQMSKRDDLMEMQSGQTVAAALTALQGKAFNAFEEFFMELQTNSGGRISLRTAADLAATLTIGLLSPIYRQIDPMHVGEAGRASSIAQQYGQRLNEIAKNLKAPQALEFLISGYSNHGFVIDQREAAKLFSRVRSANTDEQNFIDSLGETAYKPISGPQPKIEFLSDTIDKAKKSDGQLNGRLAPGTGKTRKAPASARRSGAADGGDAGGLYSQAGT